MARWHHRLNGCEFEKALGDGEEQGSLVCCSPWGHKELHNSVTEQQLCFLFLFVFFSLTHFKGKIRNDRKS